uniref:Ankyrin repeat protein n=1 Tax=Pithovirus LCPAC102 TaxID=2506587 RepID=A0A481Z356_9VIRU|nr:MAG: hypothetical protein LCPAC102_02160 [Pithovirus LCPAC102]
MLNKTPNFDVNNRRWDALLNLEKLGFLPNSDGANIAASNGYIDILDWLKDKNIYPTNRGLLFASR